MGHSTTKWTKTHNLNITYFIRWNFLLIANMIKFMDLKTKLQLNLLQKRYHKHSRHLLFCQINANCINTLIIFYAVTLNLQVLAYLVNMLGDWYAVEYKDSLFPEVIGICSE